jgi:hypothetical protein
METSAITLLIQILDSLMKHAHNSALRTVALERALKRHPELEKDYQSELAYLSSDPSSALNLQGSSELLAMLRAKLTQNQ